MNRGKNLTKEQILWLINYYNSGHTQKECADILNISNVAVSYQLNKNNVKIRSLKLDKNIEEQVIDMYTNKFLSSKVVANFLKITKPSVRAIIKRNGGKIKRSGQIYNVNENYFETIDTKDKAYFLGWLISDGNKKNNSIQINLQERDKYILELFKKYINYTGKLYFLPKKNDKRQNQYRLFITSKKLTDNLDKYGFVSNKSKITYFPDIPEEFHSHFIRGIFDGDGSIISINRKNRIDYVFSITGSISLMTTIQKIIIEKCKLSTLKICKNKDSFYFSYGGNRQVKRIGEYLYKDCDDLLLTRKKEKFDKLNEKTKKRM